MATATDIITYIGIPLAVLGVLPILYTFALSILTQRRIRNLLIAHGHKPHTTTQQGFMLRASPMTSLIEVEMPRYTIAPMSRDTERYWETDAPGNGSGAPERIGLLGHSGHSEAHVERVASTLSMIEEGRVRGFLRGGSWRTFHWRRLVVGRKLYRIQYEDELREPPAEIDFADLVNFLMDWGAELDEMGWEKLRSGGLWTPAGTVLLKTVDEVDGEDVKAVRGSQGDWVLRTSMPDDSDGILTLCVRWPPGRSYGSERDVTSLPPGWGRLSKPVFTDKDKPDPERPTLHSTITQLTEKTKSLLNTTSFRFTIESNIITTLHPESTTQTPLTPLPLSFPPNHPHASIWFITSLTSLLTLSKPTSGNLWTHTPDPTIQTFTHKETIPIGILVILGLLPPDSAPHWTTIDETDNATLATAHHRRFQARLAAERLEATMPAPQREVAKRNRELAAMREQTDEVMAHLNARRARDAKRIQDALGSSRVSVTVSANACLAWLIETRHVDADSTIVTVAAGVLYMLALQAISLRQEESEEDGKGEGEKIPVLMILEEWTSWSIAGGMKREQLEMLETYKVEFCYAACLVGVVAQAGLVSGGKGKAGVDMLECLNSWRKVRLG